MLNLTTEIFGDVVVVHAPEDLSGEQAERLTAFFETVDRRRVVFDLDRTETLDSAGLTAMVQAQQALVPQGGDLKVATTNAMNRKILEITRLDQWLEVFDSVIDAVKSFEH
jgi:anti-anti-sigma factor